MEKTLDRRDFLKLTGLAGVVFVSGLTSYSSMAKRSDAKECLFRPAFGQPLGF